MKKITAVIIIFLAVLFLAGAAAAGYFCYQKISQESQDKETSQSVTESDESQESKLEVEKVELLKLDPTKEATHLSKVADAKGAYWARYFDVVWNDVEEVKGEFDWSRTDEQMKHLQQQGIYPLANLKPFTNWDQDTCHPEAKYEAEGAKGRSKVKVGKPCDMTAYTDFLAKVVERYDGDGQDDMPGLEIPLKYWEIMNEPTMQGGSLGGAGEDLKFFVGTSQEYLDILKASYQTIKEVDSEAKVLPAGMAGVNQEFQDFWRPVLENGGGDYFDIANIHTIGTNERRDDLYIIKYKKFLEQYDIRDKPIWITEVQYGDLMGKPQDVVGLEKLMARSTAFSLAQGANVLFYIENWLYWDEEDHYLKPDKELEKLEEKESPDAVDMKEEEKKKKFKEGDPAALDSSTHKVYLNLVDKLNGFDQIETIKEEYQENPSQHDGATSTVGQYKFVSGEESVYVLWGQAELPAEITGKVLVTDIYGESEEREASEIVLSDSPVFVEMR
ncbi:MAG: hypothetical protein HQ530_00280 [Parcubacteria group bacterium]|nr:hypothetical protein [Parcubacteria group bacterium]